MDKNESKYFNTAKRMDDALVFLLGKKDFECISIKEICAQAKVNRSTFYLHYSNMNDLLEETIQSLNTSFASFFASKENMDSIASKQDLNELYLIKDEYLIPYLEFVKENKAVYKAVKNHPALFHAGSSYQAMFKSLFVPIMSRFGLTEEWHEYLMGFYIEGISAIIFRWVGDGCKIPVQDVSNFIQGLIVKRNGKENSTK